MANPNYVPDPINKLVASMSFNSFPGLNIVPEYLMSEAFDVNFTGNTSTPLAALTGVVQSGEPYVQIDVTAHIIITSPLANAFKLQLETNTQLGACTIRPVTSKLSPIACVNMAITRVSPMSMAGRDAGYAIGFGGTYNVNSGLWP